MTLEIVATLTKVIYRSDDGNFTAAEFIDAKSAKRFKAAGRIGTIGKKETQQKYRIIGDWQSNQKYGETFQAIYSEPIRPDTLKGVYSFLSNNVKGVGESTAKKLGEQLDVNSVDELIEICKEAPERIFKHLGKRKKVAQGIIDALTLDEGYRSIMIFLHEHNIPANFAKRIYEKYGLNAVDLLTQNPYRLISDFRNVGFKKADAIAQKLNIPPTSLFRIEASLVYVLESSASEGHCCLPRDFLISKATELLGGRHDPQFTFDYVLFQLRQIYRQRKEEGSIPFELRVADNKKKVLFYLPEVYLKEEGVGKMCRRLLSRQDLAREFMEKEIKEGNKTIQQVAPEIEWNRLSKEQMNAVQKTVDAQLFILTGGPGCGKTFTLKAIYALQKALKRKVALCAPTGLAAKRMTQSIGEPASTLHKLLRIGQDDTGTEMDSFGGSSALEGVDVVIVDEASMLSLDLFHILLEALGSSRRLFLVGDKDQLPSVGAGNVLRDLINSDVVPLVKLTQIFRQSSESPIPTGARQIISGQVPQYTFTAYSEALPKKENLLFIGCQVNRFYEILLPLLQETLPSTYHFDPVKDCQILVPMRKGEAGQKKINEVLQAALNPQTPQKVEIEVKEGFVIREGDKLIQMKNNYEKSVFNGDLGFCKSIVKTKSKTEVEVQFTDKIVVFDEDELYDLQHCYGMTVHKSQGSEFPICIIPMFSQFYNMLDRNLFYTALTRASQSVIIIGEDWAVKKAVKTQQAHKRFTWLEELVKPQPPNDE